MPRFHDMQMRKRIGSVDFWKIFKLFYTTKSSYRRASKMNPPPPPPTTTNYTRARGQEGSYVILSYGGFSPRLFCSDCLLLLDETFNSAPTKDKRKGKAKIIKSHTSIYELRRPCENCP